MEKQKLKLEKVVRLLEEQMAASIKDYDQRITNKYGKVMEEMEATEDSLA